MAPSDQKRLAVLCGQLLASQPCAAATPPADGGSRWAHVGSGQNATSREGTWKDQSQLGNNGIALAVPKAVQGTVRGVAKNIRVEPLRDCTMGAVIKGVSLRNDDLDDPEAWDAVYKAFLEYGILIFEGQHGITREMEGAFAERFAPLKHHLTITNIKTDSPLVLLDEDDTRKTGRHMIKRGGRGTEGWHTDVTFTPISVTTGMLSAGKDCVVPTEEGETEFCDMRAAYDALDQATKDRIEDMVTYHSLNYGMSRRTGTFYKVTPMNYPVPMHDSCYCRPLVKIHPVTGRKSLLVTCFSFGTPGLSREESTKLLDDLCNNAAQPPRIYLHKWKEGDVVIWDERCTFHRSRPYNPKMPRRLFGVRTIGGIETEGGLPSPEAIKVHQRTGGRGGTGDDALNGKEILAKELEALQLEKPWETIVDANPRGGW